MLPPTQRHDGNDADALRATIDGLYEVFARYRLLHHIAGCPCCVSDADSGMITQRPLRELTAENLSRFSFKAMTTWGTVNDFRHFLPRLLECIANPDGSNGIDPHIVLGKLQYGQWGSWPEEERAAVRRFLLAWWSSRLGQSPETMAGIEDWICAIGQAEDDLASYLAMWVADGRSAAGENLADMLIERGNDLLTRGELHDSFWAERPTQMRQLVGWLASAAVHERLEQTFFECAGTPVAERLSLACTVQEGLAERVSRWMKE